jgi:hypothetical protein
MSGTDRIHKILLDILNIPEERQRLIGEFQHHIWESKHTDQNSKEWKIYSDLALDLEYFEPDSKLRVEDYSFYGEEKLIELIQEALSNLNPYLDEQNTKG